MTPESLVDLREQALRYACRKGFTEYAGDFAGYAVVRALQGGDEVTLQLRTLLVDFKRAWFGSTRHEYGVLKSNAQRGYGAMNSRIGATVSNRCRMREIAGVTALEGEQRVIFFLHYLYGFTALQVAETLGIGEHQAHYKIRLVFKEAVLAMKREGVEA